MLIKIINAKFKKGIRMKVPKVANVLASKDPIFPPKRLIIAKVTKNNKGAAINILV